MLALFQFPILPRSNVQGYTRESVRTFMPRICCAITLTAPIRGAINDRAGLLALKHVLHAICIEENAFDCVGSVVVMGRKEVKRVRRSGRSIVRGSILVEVESNLMLN
jgi:hypothetical protein